MSFGLEQSESVRSAAKGGSGVVKACTAAPLPPPGWQPISNSNSTLISCSLSEDIFEYRLAALAFISRQQ